MSASCVHPIAMRVRRAEMVRAVIDRCSVCERDVEWVFVGDQDWPQGDALHVHRPRLACKPGPLEACDESVRAVLDREAGR